MTIRIPAILVASALLPGAAQTVPERVVPEGGIIAVTLNGKSGHARAEPAAPGIPLFTTAFATGAGLRQRGLGFSLGYSVGPVGAMHTTAVTELDAGGGIVKRRVGWGKRPYSAVADGTIGPAALPDPVVRFVLHAPRAGERTFMLPMVDGGGLFGRFSGQFAQIEVAGKPMRVRLDPYHAQTLANAGAGLRLAGALGGTLSGPLSQVEIAFGIERPVRQMDLVRPLLIGPLSIARLGVRTIDGGNANGIAEAGGAVPDPDEIVVTARGKKRDTDRDRLSIGADQLGRCSSIVFDKPAKQIRLTCG